jgi:aminomethyltransferase
MAKRSHLYRYHKERGKIVEFAGYEMPLWYSGILEEHMAVRNSAGLFDVSHMGRFWIIGKQATNFLDHVLPSDVARVKPQRAFYSTICNDSGGIVDDTVTSKFSEEKYLMVVNAANIEKDYNWLKGRMGGFEAELHDSSEESALIAIQGPTATEILQKVSRVNLQDVKRFGVVESVISGESCILSRTGYTGEDGFEIAVPNCPRDSPEKVEKIWDAILANETVIPCGLGARDLLRLEAGMCLYGQDLDDSTTPIEASISFVVGRDKKADYAGKEIIERQLKEGTQRKRVSFFMISDGIPRHGYEITFAGNKIGEVTSGSFSPILKKGIGMAYTHPEFSEIGSKFSVKLRNIDRPAEVVKTPFYDTDKFGYARKC